MIAPDLVSTTHRPVSAAAISERRLVEGLIRQDPQMIGEFLSSSWRSVRAAASRLTRDPDLREDWTHDVLLRILDDLANRRFEYRWPGCFWSWFRLRTRGLLLNRLEQHRREWMRRVDLDDHLAMENSAVQVQPLSRQTSPVEDLERAEIRDLLLRSLQSLESDHHRRALELRMLEGKSYHAIATEMEVPVNTVRSWIRRGRLALREKLAPAYREDVVKTAIAVA